MKSGIVPCSKSSAARWLWLGLFLPLFFLSSPLFGQQSARLDSLRDARARLNREILNLNTARDSTRTKKEATLAQISVVTQQIQLRKELLRTMQREIDQLNKEIKETTENIAALEEEIQGIRDEYGDLMVVTYKAMHNKSSAFYLLSAKSVSQGYKRMQYFKAISRMQEQQVQLLKEKKAVLDQQKYELELRKVEKEALAQEEKKEQGKLLALKKEQKRLLAQLKADEEKFTAQIQQTKSKISELNKAISKEIERLAAKSDNSAAAKALSKDFAKNKGRLPWPLPKSVGTVTRKFGKNKLPDSNTEIDLQGIDIATREDQSIRAIFGGKVAQVMPVPGQGKIVIVQHGDYYSVYANLKDVLVTAGSEVRMLQTLGVARTDGEGASKVHFQIYKGRTPQNPESWLVKK